MTEALLQSALRELHRLMADGGPNTNARDVLIVALTCEAGIARGEERARAARIARESVAADLAEKFPDARRLADQIAADIEGDQV